MVGQVESREHVLLDEQDGEAGPIDLAQHFGDPLDDTRRQAERELVDHEQTRPRHQAAADRAHLLFSSRERRRILPSTFAENRKHRVDLFEIAFEIDERLAAQVGAEEQVVANGQALEESPALGYVCDSRAQDFVRRGVRQVATCREYTRPLVGLISPEIARSSVDLPAPFDPTRQTMLPRSTVRSAPHSTCTWP